MTHSGLHTQDGPPVPLPFSSERLDAALEQLDLDLLVVTSKHNVRYLLGGHHHPFFEASDAIGVSRYLPILLYWPRRPELACYIGSRNEKDVVEIRNREGRPLWPPLIKLVASTSQEAASLACEHIAKVGRPGRIGVEAAFLPWDAAQIIAARFPEAALVDAFRPLERLRAIKSPSELDLLRRASDLVVAAMLAVMKGHGPGTSKRQLIEALRREETARGLQFDYALVTVGRDLNRAASDQTWLPGEVLSMDSGGTLDGYIGDLCRMAVLGEPDGELEDLLAEVRTIQDAARAAATPGLPGREVVSAGRDALSRSPNRAIMQFVAHGMGLVAHEAPRLMADGPIPYPDEDADLPLEAGMVLSIETTLAHPGRGFIKLEDTVAITPEGPVGFGDRGRGWTQGGVR